MSAPRAFRHRISDFIRGFGSHISSSGNHPHPNLSRRTGEGTRRAPTHPRLLRDRHDGIDASAEPFGVGAVAAVQQVLRAAVGAEEAVVAVFAVHRVDAGPAGQLVVAEAAMEDVAAGCAIDHVVTPPRPSGRCCRRAGDLVGGAAADRVSMFAD